MRIAVLADIGQPVYHVGDEAIGLATAMALRERGVDPVMLARDPDLLESVYDGVDRASTITVPWGIADRVALFERVRTGRGPLPADVAALRDVLATCDGLHIAGGGNLTSRYGWLLTERAIAVAVARSLGLRITLSGQTIGPAVHAADRDQLAFVAESCAALGVRDSRSAAWLTAEVPLPHGVRIGVDDATFLAAGPDVPATPRHIAATFSPGLEAAIGDDGLRRVAALLDAASAEAGLPVRFEPHMQTAGTGDIDGEVHARIAAHMTASSELAPVASAAATAASMAEAALVVTNRFHPVVFASRQGVPIVALGDSHYVNARIDGALQHWGLRSSRAPVAAVFDDGFVDHVRGILGAADGIRAHLAAQRTERRDAAEKWWDAVAGAGPIPDSAAPAPELTPVPAPAWWACVDELEDRLETAQTELGFVVSAPPAGPRPSLLRRGLRYVRRRLLGPR